MNSKTSKTVKALTVLVVVLFSAQSFAGDCSSRKVQAMQRMSKGASEVYDKTIESPDTSFIEDCLGSIKNPSFGLNLGIPSIDDLIQKACNMMKSKITDQVSGLDYTFDTNGFGNGFGSGSSANDVSYSGEIPITGNNNLFGNNNTVVGSQPYVSSPQAYMQPDIEESAPQESNSSYLESTVRSAINFITGK